MVAYRIRKDAFFSHATAARLLGAPLPWTMKRDDVLHVSVPSPESAPHATGIRGHSLTVTEDEVVQVGGMRATSAARTWVDLASTLSLGHLVALGDYFIHWRSPLTSSTVLEHAVSRMAGRRGAKRAREALGLLSDRAESAPESELRVILVKAGLPLPEVNHVLVETTGGRDMRLDLSYPELKIAIEYMGDYHRSQTQWRRDMTRRSRLEAKGWYVLELNADDLKDPIELAARIRTLLVRHSRHTNREFA